MIVVSFPFFHFVLKHFSKWWELTGRNIFSRTLFPVVSAVCYSSFWFCWPGLVIYCAFYSRSWTWKKNFVEFSYLGKLSYNIFLINFFLLSFLDRFWKRACHNRPSYQEPRALHFRLCWHLPRCRPKVSAQDAWSFCGGEVVKHAGRESELSGSHLIS